MQKRTKTIKYQSRYFERDIPKKLFQIKMSSDGSFELIDKSAILDLSSFIYLLMGLTGIVFNIIENYHFIIYLLSAGLILIFLTTLVLGLIQKKRKRFEFIIDEPKIVYNLGYKSLDSVIQFNDGLSIRCDIETLYMKHGTQPLYFSRHFIKSKDEDELIIQTCSKVKQDCLKFGKALTRYLSEVTDIKELPLKETN